MVQNLNLFMMKPVEILKKGLAKLQFQIQDQRYLNQMDLAELLNPAIESHNMFNATDEDIFNSVMEVKKLQEGNLGGDSDNDADLNSDLDVSACTPEPTHHELLQAALML